MRTSTKYFIGGITSIILYNVVSDYIMRKPDSLCPFELDTLERVVTCASQHKTKSPEEILAYVQENLDVIKGDVMYSVGLSELRNDMKSISALEKELSAISKRIASSRSGDPFDLTVKDVGDALKRAVKKDCSYQYFSELGNMERTVAAAPRYKRAHPDNPLDSKRVVGYVQEKLDRMKEANMACYNENATLRKISDLEKEASEVRSEVAGSNAPCAYEPAMDRLEGDLRRFKNVQEAISLLKIVPSFACMGLSMFFILGGAVKRFEEWMDEEAKYSP